MLKQTLVSELEKIQNKLSVYVSKGKSYSDQSIDVILESLSDLKGSFSILSEKDPQHRPASDLLAAIDDQLTALYENEEIRAIIVNKNLLPNTKKKRL